MKITVKSITGVKELREANSFVTGKESKMTLKTCYRMGHTNMRTIVFKVFCYDIPQYVAYHLRTHFTLMPLVPVEMGWMRSKRTDRGGEDFREICNGIARDLRVYDNADTRETLIQGIESLPGHFDRMAPTDFYFWASAEGLMAMANKRLCTSASKETRQFMNLLKEEIGNVDPDLYPHLVRPCIACGICREVKPCGYMDTEVYKTERNNYKKLFV